MRKHQHFIIHKPYGYLSQFVNNQNKRRNKKLLGELCEFPEGIMSIGRLDETSEGLLLLTTDGKVSEQVRSKKIEKEYFAQVDGEITEEAIQQLQAGVEIGLKSKKYQTLPSKVHALNPAPIFEARTKKIRDERHGPTSWISITIREGKFRQVRKMTAAVGFPTLRLVRVRIGSIQLDQLSAGQIIEVNNFDLMNPDNLQINLAIILRKIGTAKCLEKAKSIESVSSPIHTIHLRDLALNSSNVMAIADCLKQEMANKHSLLKSISFSYNTLLADSGAIVLAKNLPESLSEIGLVNCGIGDIGGAELLEWMKRSTNLKMICMEQNNFSEEFRKELKKYSLSNPQTLVIF